MLWAYNRLPPIQKMSKYNLKKKVLKRLHESEQKLNYLFASPAEKASREVNEMLEKVKPLTVYQMQTQTRKVDKHFQLVDVDLAQFENWKASSGQYITGM